MQRTLFHYLPLWPDVGTEGVFIHLCSVVNGRVHPAAFGEVPVGRDGPLRTPGDEHHRLQHLVDALQ